MSLETLANVRVAFDAHVAVVTLDRPPVNAQTLSFQEEIAYAFDYLSDLDEVRAIVLTGAGKVFCAGVDLKERAGKDWAPAERRDSLRSARESYHAVMECTKPVIAAINGAALGAGLALAASCDILIASQEASLGLPEVTVGLMGGARHAMQLFSRSRLRRMMLTGDRVDGAELYRLGIVEACVPAAELMPQAVAMAHRIAAHSPVATRLAKHSLNTIETMSLRDGYRFEQDMTLRLAGSQDSREAMLAFKEKRPPVFKGR